MLLRDQVRRHDLVGEAEVVEDLLLVGGGQHDLDAVVAHVLDHVQTGGHHGIALRAGGCVHGHDAGRVGQSGLGRRAGQLGQ